MERRKYHRARLSSKPIVHAGGEAFEAMFIDISVSGAAVSAEHQLEPGSHIRMRWSFADGKPAEVGATVVRVQKMSTNSWLYGLAFQDLEAAVVARLERWVRYWPRGKNFARR
jgi:hypothetical protein